MGLIVLLLVLAATCFLLAAFRFKFRHGDRVLVNWFPLGLFFLRR